jgi:hypothetical protein
VTDERGLQQEAEVHPCGLTVVPLAKKNDSLLPSVKTMLPLFFAGPLACLLVILAAPFRRLIVNLRTYRRKTGALRRAQGACRKAKDPAGLLHAVRAYLAERLGLVSGSALTPGDAVTALISHGVSEALAGQFQALLVRLEEALYRPDAVLSLGESAKQVAEVLAAVDKEVAP